MIKQPVRVDSLAWFPDTPEIRKAYTKESRFNGEVELFTVANGLVGVPRQEYIGDPTIDDRSCGTKIAINSTVPPRNSEQQRVINQSVALLHEDRSHIIRATTGFGKTYVGVSIAARMKTTTLIVVTKEDLMGEDQWRGAIKKFTDCHDSEIGIIRQDVCDYKGKKFVLAMVHSLAKDKYPAALKDHFGLVIWDEVHRLGAESFSKSCGMFSAKWRLGLSATPQRVDGKDFVFHAHIGPVLVEADLVPMKLKVLTQTTKFKLPVVSRRIDGVWKRVPLPHEAGKMMGVSKALAQDEDRNTMIVKFVLAAWKKGRKTIVFSDLKDSHLEPLFHRCVAAGIPAEDMSYYVGGMSEKKRTIAKTKKVLWATYAMTAEATDIPTLDTAVFATPRANITQAVGRILRQHPDKNQPIVLDLIDPCSDVLRAFAGKRKVEYLKLGADVLAL